LRVQAWWPAAATRTTCSPVRYEQARLFHLGWPFLVDHLVFPGGPLELLAALATQAYHHAFLGAFVLVLLGGLTFVCARALLVPGVGAPVALLTVLPLALMIGGYDHSLAAALGVPVALGVALLHERVLPRRGPGRQVASWATFLALVYLAGGAAVVGIGLVVVFELLGAERRAGAGRLLSLGAALAVGLAVPWLVDEASLGPGAASAYRRFFFSLPPLAPGLRRPLPAAVPWLLLPVLLVAAARWLRRRPAESSSSRLPVRAQVIVVLAGVAAAHLSLDPVRRATLRIDEQATRGRWAEVVRAARELPPAACDRACQHDVARALAQTGRLGDELLRLRPRVEALLLHPTPRGRPSVSEWVKKSHVYLELGNVNLAEKYALDVLPTGPFPEVLHQLARIQLVKERPESARVYLQALRRDLVWRGRADELLRRLAVDPRLSSDREVRRLRAVRLERDRVWKGEEVRHLLPELMGALEERPSNRLAFEYLLAVHLLTWRLQEVVGSVARLEALGYGRIPRHVEEAILVHRDLRGGRADLHGLRLSRESRAAFTAFSAAIQRHAGDKQAARRSLAPRFSGTYFFHDAFGGGPR